MKNSEINFIDIGCAGGALTALLCLNTLAAHGLLNKTNIYLADICEDVLRDNKQIFNGKNGDTFKELIESDMIDYINDKIKEITGENDGIMSFWRNRDSILKQIKKAKLFKMDSTKISVTNKWEVDNNIYLEWSSEKISKTDKYEEIDFTNKFDIVVSGFTHHHQNYVEKKKSCEEMVKIAKEKGFIGIVDECLTYEEYNDFLLKHKATEIPPSMESFISLRDHLSLFKDQPVRVMEYMDVDGKKWNFRDLNEYSTPKRIDMLLEKENLPPFSEISLEKKEYKYYYFSLIREL
ncbi:MAG TPA: hypothetical protein ENI52_00220 [Thermoplasmata archaeon]|nr:hypothetical protein [Thermoplasmata archaeon]